MARTKQTRTCYRCKAPFTWESTTGSVRQHNLDGTLHYCSKTPQVIPPVSFEPIELSQTKPNQTEQSESSNQAQPEANSTPAQSKSDSLTQTMQDRLAQAMKSIENKKNAESKSESQEQEQEKPKENDLYKLIRPNVLADIDLKIEPVTEAIETLSSLTIEAVSSLDTKINEIKAEVEKRSNETKTITHEIVVTLPTAETIKIENAHAQTADLVRFLSLGLNVILVGPAGSGKTYSAELAATALGLKFLPISLGPQTSKSDLLGYTDAHGRPVWTVIREAYVNGGVLLLDEIDAANAGVLTCINAILANNRTTFPASVDDTDNVTVETKHANFRVVASANTYGNGASRMYVGRQQLDAATLDRFVGIDWAYDLNLENKLGASYPEYLKFIHDLRKAQERLAIRCVFSLRAIIDGVKMLDAGVSIEAVKASRVFFGVSADDKAKLLQAVR